MKRLFSLMISFWAIVFAAMAQMTAARAFIDAPTSRFPLIQKMKRMDMVDYKNSGVDRPSENLLGGKSKILSLTPEKIVVEECEEGTSVTSISVDLSSKGDTVLIVTADVATPAPDGMLTVYDSHWNRLGKNVFTQPKLTDWIRQGSAMSLSDIENAVPFVMASYSYDPMTHILTLTNTLSQYLPEKEYDKVSGEMLSQLTYRWNGKKMVRIKPSK